MGMRKAVSQLVWHDVEEGKESSCLIPVAHPNNGCSIEVRCRKDVAVNAVTVDGQILPLEVGKIVRWSGPTQGYTSVEIVADTGFWYRAQVSSRWYEFVDPVPMVVEMTHTQQDVIKSMIEERLRQYTMRMELDRELSDDEKDDLILDIARGDLEFDDEPDQFGLGYEERLAAFHAEPFKPSSVEEPEEVAPAEKPAGESQNSSST